jgi:hypothetical protein
MKSVTGGPAFPVPGLQHDEDFNGMTLRDYFAGQALIGIASGEGVRACLHSAQLNNVSPRQVAAKVAYDYADAMLAARGAA